MPYCCLRGYPHYYEWVTAAQTGQPSGKPVLVFIHGWGGSARYWQDTAAKLSEPFDCLLYDLRGFGRSRLSKPDQSITASVSDLENPYALETYARDLAELLEALGIGRIFLNAHSMGASIGVLFMNRYADRVERAILTCSGIFEYDKSAFEAFYRFGGYVVKFRPRSLYSLPFVDRLFMKRFLHRPLSGQISRAFLDDFLMADYDAAMGTIFTSVSKEATEVMPQEFAQLHQPTLLISGEHDIIIPAEMGRQAAQLNDRIQYRVIANTAHFPMLEDSDTYLQQVQEFLAVSDAATPNLAA